MTKQTTIVVTGALRVNIEMKPKELPKCGFFTEVKKSENMETAIGLQPYGTH